MPKQVQYNVEEILDYSIDIFCSNGYANSSIEEIIGKTGFNRRGFYIEFQNKQIFLHRVLEHYIKTRLHKCQTALINDKQNGIASIKVYFDEYHSLIRGNGCLLVSCINELGKIDPTVQSIARHYYDSLQLCFISCLETAQKYGGIKQNVNIESIALQLTCYTQGFAVSNILADGEVDVVIAMRDLLHSITV